jgi:hypothetical protein
MLLIPVIVVAFIRSISWGVSSPDPPEQVQGPESLRMLLIPVIVVAFVRSTSWGPEEE